MPRKPQENPQPGVSKDAPVGKVSANRILGKEQGQTPMAGTEAWAKANGLQTDEDND